MDMANNGKGNKPRSQTASKLFHLFKETESYDIIGPAKEKIPILFRNLDYGQNAILVREMDLLRSSIKHDLEADDLRAGLSDQAIRLTREKLMEAVLNLERPVVEEQVDLAPGADPDAVEAAKKEKEAAERWEGARKIELDEMADKDLRSLIVDRQTRLLVNSRLLGEFMNYSLVHMVLDPETREPMFTADAFECPQCGKRSRDVSAATVLCCEQPMALIENFIGRLAPQIRDQLVDFRREFTAPKDEQAIRKTAESNAFLPSGESPRKPGDSPGGTTETPLISLPASSAATAEEPGGTV